MKLSQLYWTLPFFFFLFGYFFIFYFTHISYIETPTLVGKSLFQACDILSESNLNMRILAKKEDPDLPLHTVVSQTPTAHQKIKPYQSVFLVITTKQTARLAPQCVGKSQHIIEQECIDSTFHTRFHYVPSLFAKHQCIAQTPNPHEPLNRHLILYCSNGNNTPFIWPDFTNKTIEQVVDFLYPYGINPEIISLNKKNYTNQSACVVIDQRPRAGTLVTLEDNKPPHVQLCIK